MRKAEKIHMDKVASLGCIICANPNVELHHITTRTGMGKKASNFEVLPLCAIHHRLGNHGTALHAGVKTWEENFGTQIDLLKGVNEQVGYQDDSHNDYHNDRFNQ